MNHTCLQFDRPHAPRGGLTLLEVLISTFVLSIGLLGLLSLVPVGGYRVGQVNQFDRASTTGRHAFREFKTRDMLEPNKWMWWDNTAADYIRTWEIPKRAGVASSAVSRTNVDNWAETFCIDPLYIARAASAGTPAADWPGRTFPYNLNYSGLEKAPKMPRVTLSMLEDSSTPPVLPNPPRAIAMVNSVAERIFMSQNDGIFNLPTDEAETPVRMYTGDTAYIEQFQGDYSWMAIVSRSPQEVLPVEDPVSSGNYFDISPAIRNEYKVSTVVFNKRDFDVDVQELTGSQRPQDVLASERICGIDFLNGLGLGGGDVRIIGDDAANMSAAEANEYLSVSPNQWIMVCAWAPRQQTPTPSATIYPQVYGQDRLARPVYRWYRVIATDRSPEVVDIGGTQTWVRYLTLDGPDWDPNEFCNINGTPITPGSLTDTYAVLVDGVVAVFERTMRRQE